MPAYLIAEHVITDAAKFEQYRSEAPIEEGTSMIVEVPYDRVTSWNV